MPIILRVFFRGRLVPVLLLLAFVLLVLVGCDRSANRIPVSALAADDAWQSEVAGGWLIEEGTDSQLFKISGVVSEKESKQAIGNIVIDLFFNGIKRLSTRSTSAGTFIFENIPPGLYDVTTSVDSAKYIATQDVVRVIADGSVSPANLEIFLEAARSSEPGKIEYPVNGEVRDERTGQTLSGEFIRLVDSSEATVAATQSDSQGKFVFGKVVAGAYKIVAAQSSDKYFPFSLALQVAENGAVSPYPLLLMRLQTEQSVIMAGQVVLSNTKEPLGGMVVSLYRGEIILEETRVNGAGKFFFENLQPGTYMLKIADSDNKYEAVDDYFVTILSDGTVSPDIANIELTLKQGKVVTGFVYDIVGKILDAYTGSALDFVTCNLRDVGPIITDMGGNFYFENLAPGSYSMEISKSGFNSQPVKFELTASGDTIPASLTFRLVSNQEQNKGSIVGRVVDAGTGEGRSDKYIKIYVLRYIGDYGNEKIWNLDPRPIKETRSNTTAILGDYSEVGAFKITHLEPTNENMKYLVYVGDDDNNITTMSAVVGVINIIAEDVSATPPRFYSWSQVDVVANTSTYLTNYEPYNF